MVDFVATEKRKQLYWLNQLRSIEFIYRNDVPRDFDRRSSVTRKGGRPYSFTPQEIDKAMWRYFYRCVMLGMPFTITGLCLAIGISRKGLWNLEKSENSQFLHTIKKGRQIIEMYWENEIHQRSNPFGAMFLLRRMGWDASVRGG